LLARSVGGDVHKHDVLRLERDHTIVASSGNVDTHPVGDVLRPSGHAEDTHDDGCYNSEDEVLLEL
jgi:hypothetical protein